MKKSKILTIVPILATCFSLSGCSEPISTENGLDGVYAAIDAINATDYRSQINTMVYYTKASYTEPFAVPAEFVAEPCDENAVTPKAADTRVINDEVLTRIDFTNPDDMYYYNFTIRTFKYLTSYDNKTGTAGYTDTIVRFGYQFYKNDKGNYQLDMIGSRGIEKPKSLKLADYPYITPSTELNNLENLVTTGKNTFNKEQATVLFNELFTKIVEHNYRINRETVDLFESDKTGGYKYSATETSLEITENGVYEFDYKAPIITNSEIKITNIEKGQPVENSDLIKVSVSFSNGRKVEIEILESNFPEDLTPETYNTVSEIIPESNTWMVFDIDTKVPATETIVDGANVPVLNNTSAGLDKNQNINEKFTVSNKFWANTETKKAEGEREFSMVYGNYGFLTSSHISDERLSKEFLLNGCKKFYTSYYTTAEFNVEVPHVHGGK
jgi:hypothetical protein